MPALEEEMHQAAKDLRFEYAARLRDEVQELRRELRRCERPGSDSAIRRRAGAAGLAAVRAVSSRTSWW